MQIILFASSCFMWFLQGIFLNDLSFVGVIYFTLVLRSVIND